MEDNKLKQFISVVQPLINMHHKTEKREKELLSVVQNAMDGFNWPLAFGVMLMTGRNCAYIGGDQDITLEQIKRRVRETIMVTYRSIHNSIMANPDSLLWGETRDRDFHISVSLTPEHNIDNIQIHYVLTSSTAVGDTV